MDKKSCLTVVGLLILSWAIVVGVIALIINIGKIVFSMA